MPKSYEECQEYIKKILEMYKDSQVLGAKHPA
jgi:hypothetical protein